MTWELKGPREALRDGARVGKITGIATLAACAVAGQIENGDAISPINAISHATWGEDAYAQNTVSLKYSATAIAINDSAMYSWAALFECFFGHAADRGEVGKTLLGGALVSAFAYVFDYKIVPSRFTPGIERHLSGRSIFAVYLVLALGLAAGGLSRRR